MKKFLEDEQANFTTELDSFTVDCKKTVKELKEDIANYIAQIRYTRLNRHILEINFGLRDKNLIDYGDINLNRKKEIKSKTDAVNNYYGKSYLVNSPIAKFTKSEMCLTDIEFIESALENIDSNEPLQSETIDVQGNLALIKATFNKYDNIFSNNGFELFKYILETCIRKDRGRKDDVSYYYRRMHQDKFIHQSPEPFKTWFEENYEELGKIKTLIVLSNQNRKNLYAAALEWYKSKE